MTPLALITDQPLDPQALISAVSPAAERGRSGAVATFLGLVRAENAGHRVSFLVYEAYDALAVKSFERIIDEARDAWPSVAVAIHHRTGRLLIGDTSVAIAAASPHRADAFAACRYAIERLKQIAPIWKHEHFEGGAVWIEGAVTHPDDNDAREEARRRACVSA